VRGEVDDHGQVALFAAEQTPMPWDHLCSCVRSFAAAQTQRIQAGLRSRQRVSAGRMFSRTSFPVFPEVPGSSGYAQSRGPRLGGVSIALQKTRDGHLRRI
jgi:hypothetical protein